ncbi:MAG: chemotaxis response regulator protein-glutamate methylesterase [Thermodesulfobacteriota bacterium]|nr:MAG: chemotaxis response regulator protein-glutamate methylesterase [Thermodesulfobacteriota bacterium]
MTKKTKVLVIDDSAVVRKVLTTIIGSEPDIEVVGAASDPFIAAEKIAHDVPDVITLDVEMPRMDGITFLQKMMSQHPIPTVVISSLAGSGSETALRALEYGAVEILQKPSIGTKEFLEESRVLICDAVRAASVAKLRRVPVHAAAPAPKLNADAVIAKSRPTKAMLRTTEKVVILGASTGGTEAISDFLMSMPLDSPGIVIVQHMPEKFTASFAKRLDSACRISVKEAEDNDTVIRGRALIAPGNRHMMLKRSGARYYVEIKDGPLVSRHRPSVDVLFRSAAMYAGKNAVGVILTGMGDDGSRGMKEMKEAGSFNIAQDERTSVVYGMPKEAIKAGAVDCVLPLNEIAGRVLKECA